jgi:hypothetical protein
MFLVIRRDKILYFLNIMTKLSKWDTFICVILLSYRQNKLKFEMFQLNIFFIVHLVTTRSSHCVNNS